MEGCWSKGLAVAAILVVHAAVLDAIVRADYEKTVSENEMSSTESVTAEFIELGSARYEVPAPDLQVVTAVTHLNAPQAIPFDDSVEDELAEVISSASAPRLARVQSVDPASFARRAHLPPGRSVTVVLRVEVTTDGSVDSADVVRSSGNVAADAAAIDYALALRWIPGTRDHQPTTARVSLPVTLFTPISGPTAL